MADLGPISDKTFAEAGAVIRAVSGAGAKPDIEVMPGFEQMVAGSALALSEGAPSVFWDGRPSHAEDYLEQGREEWRHFHVAVARVIDIHRDDPGSFETPGDVMTHMVADVMHQARARRMALAIDNTDPAFQKYLSNASRDTVAYAREDKEIADLIRAEARGDYSGFDPVSQREISNSLVNGEYVTEASRDAINIAETVIERHLQSLPAIERERDSRLADFQDFGSPLLAQPTEAHWERASRLMSGAVAPNSEVERGIVAHVGLEEHDAVRRAQSSVPDMNSGIEVSERMAAYARSLARASESNALYVDAGTEAARIEADISVLRRLQETATEKLYSDLQEPMHLDAGSQRGLLAVAAGNLDKAGPDVQVEAFSAIRNLDGVAPLRQVDLAFAAAAVERGDMVVGVMREARENEAKRMLTYEGANIDTLREQEDRWKDYLYMPGDKVRINDQASIFGVDKEEIRSKLGNDPVEVAQTIVRGEDRANGLGSTYEAVYTEYEFKGHEGRFPTAQFQHERGDEHHYGAMMMKDEKLWFVPMNEDISTPEVTGAAREVVSVLPSIDGLKSIEEAKDLFRDAASGEFVIRPEAFGMKTGSVEMVGSPWMSGLNEDEKKLVDKAISKAQADNGVQEEGQVRKAMIGASLANGNHI